MSTPSAAVSICLPLTLMTPDLSPENMYWLAGGTARLCTAARWPSPVVALRMAWQERQNNGRAVSSGRGSSSSSNQGDMLIKQVRNGIVLEHAGPLKVTGKDAETKEATRAL